MPVAVALFLLALLSRLPFLTNNLYEHDSVLYARGIETFDPTAQRPHPPGYLWYVLLGRAVTALTGDPNRALTLISAVAGALAVVLLYLLARRMYDERTGRIAALFLLTSVAFWARGAVAYPYTLLAVLAILVVLLLWRAIEADGAARGKRLVVASAAWGIAVGFRTDLALDLAPLWLTAALLSRATIAQAAAGAAAATASAGVWVLSTGALTPGGLPAFITALREQSAFIFGTSSVWGDVGNLGENARALARYIWRDLYALGPLLAVGTVALSVRGRRARPDRSSLALLAWMSPAAAYYLLIHVGEYGHTFAILPALVIVAARGAIALADRIPGVPRAWLVAVPVLLNASIFLFTDSPLSARDLARRDQGVGAKAAWVRAHLDPARTVLITAYDKVIIEHYAGGAYTIVVHDPAEAADLEVTCALKPPCGRDMTVVLWDEILPAAEGWTTVALPGGAFLRSATSDEDVAVRRQRGGRLRPGGSRHVPLAAGPFVVEGP